MMHHFAPYFGTCLIDVALRVLFVLANYETSEMICVMCYVCWECWLI
jgi:hypothetical protein